jgi:hypothetical protein
MLSASKNTYRYPTAWARYCIFQIFNTLDGSKLNDFFFFLFLKIFAARHLHLAGGGARLRGEELRPLRVQGAARSHQVEHPCLFLLFFTWPD